MFGEINLIEEKNLEAKKRNLWRKKVLGAIRNWTKNYDYLFANFYSSRIKVNYWSYIIEKQNNFNILKTERLFNEIRTKIKKR
jgi:hypothetical protein